MVSDGEYITDNIRRKINGNFARILQLMQTELPVQQQQSIANSVTTIVDNILDSALPELRNEIMDDLMPVGSVIVTHTSSDPRLSHGTWQQIGGGRYVRAAGGGIQVGETGGSSQVTLTASNIPTDGGTEDSGGSRLLVSANPPEGPSPIEIEPEYVALLFYRRIA